MADPSTIVRVLDQAGREETDTWAGCFLGQSGMLLYDRYLAQGLLIATGVIEGTCGHIVGDRMRIIVARRGLPGTEAVLRQRTVQLREDFDGYWSSHVSQEYGRDHLALCSREPVQVAA